MKVGQNVTILFLSVQIMFSWLLNVLGIHYMPNRVHQDLVEALRLDLFLTSSSWYQIPTLANQHLRYLN